MGWRLPGDKPLPELMPPSSVTPICSTRWGWVKITSLTLEHSYDHYDDVTVNLMASQITSLTIVYSTVYSGADQRKHQSSASLAFVRGIHRAPVNSPHKWPVTRKMFPFDDVIMCPVDRKIFSWNKQVYNFVPTINVKRNERSACIFRWIYCAYLYICLFFVEC